MFDVQKIISSINKTGVADSSHFEVWLFGPDTLGERDMQYRADTVELPGRSISTIDHKFTNYGPISKVAYQQSYSPASITFLLSEDLREKDYFETWQNAMIDTGAYEAWGAQKRTKSKFNVKYFDEYNGRVEIRQFGADGGIRTIHVLQEAYPISISPTAMSWENSAPAKLSVSFTYKNYRYITEDNSNQPGLGTGFSFNLGKNGLSGSLRVPGFGNISSKSGLGTLANLDKGLLTKGANKIASIFKF
jgi:hypothetical protein